MTEKKQTRSASLFLMELILSILFFSLAAAVCVQLFARARILSRDAAALQRAANECAAVAETVSVSESSEALSAALLQMYPQAVCGKTAVDIHFDESFAPCGAADAVYDLCAEIAEEGTMLTAQISVQKPETGDVLYELAARHHLQRRVGDA